jgi:capsular exopolysaccharide synthesis family protein
MGRNEGRYAQATAVSAFDLNEIIRLLWRQKLIIIGTVVILTALALVVIFLMTPVYTATAMVVLDPTIDPRQRHAVDIQSGMAGLPADNATVQTEIQVLMSRDLAAKVATQLNLDQNPEFNPALRPTPWYAEFNPVNLIPDSWASLLWPKPPSRSLDPDRQSQADSVIDAFLAHLEVTAVGPSRALAVAFSSEDPRIAAEAANALANAYVDAQLVAKIATTQKSNKWLTDQLTKLREQVEASQRAVETYRNEAGLLMGRDITVATQEMTDLGQQLLTAQARRAEAEANLRQAQSASASEVGTIPEVLRSSLIEQLRKEETLLTAQAAQLSMQRGPNHPDMISIRSQISDVQSGIAAEIARIIVGLRNEVKVARAQEEELRERLQKAKGDVGQANEALGQLQALEGEAQANQTLYDSFLATLKQTGGDDLFQEADAHLVSSADIPNSPSFPRKKMLLLLVVAASGFLGVVLAFTGELLDEGVRSMDQVETQMYARALGLVPELRRSRRKPEDDILVHRDTTFAESLRSLHTGVMMLSADPGAVKTILITSTVPKEGKTTIAVGLARLLVGAGKRVIVVDCDLRRPQVHVAFGMAVEPGLANHLTGQVEIDKVIRRDPKSGAEFIPAGRDSFDSSALFESERMRELLDDLSKRYDLVILDSAPVLAVSDTRVLCRLVNKTVYVVRWADTRRKAAVNGVRQVLEAGGDLAGVVLTRVNVKRHAQYGFADSGYYSGSMTAYYSR